MHARLLTRSAVLAAATVLALAGCADSGTATSGAATVVTVDDAWVKAAGSGMSAAFGTLTNTGTQDRTVVSATTPASTTVELHETVEGEAGEMLMRPKAEGFTIPAGGTLTLEPGGNHIMLMDLVEPVAAGDEVPFVLTFSDGSTLELTAPAKDFAGANETYDGGHEHGTAPADPDHPDMDDMDHMDTGDQQ